ncbi:MAG TPA: hypothetical protein VKA19_11445 [Alphaproteobacteria bacterium]|nr:hypothetical protein [Alphaproteobacteria bacterium]
MSFGFPLPGRSASGFGNTPLGGVPAAITGLDFPGNYPNGPFDGIRFRFTGAALLPRYPATYIWRCWPRSGHEGYWTAFFWGGDDDSGSLSALQDPYYGFHPYPPGGATGTGPFKWEISVNHNDYQSSGDVVEGAWYQQVARVYEDTSGGTPGPKVHEYYWNWPNQSTDVVTRTEASTYGNSAPANPALTFGDAPWNPGNEIWDGYLRGFQIYDALLTPAEITSEISTPGSVRTPWYLNLNPTPSDISDKSGNGHDPAWVNTNRPALWEG